MMEKLLLKGFKIITTNGWSDFWKRFKINFQQGHARTGLLNSLKNPIIFFNIEKNVEIITHPILSIVLQEDLFDRDTLNLLYQSLGRQTLNSFEIVSYSENAKRVTIWHQNKYESRISREYGSLQEINSNLTGKYIYVPGEHFLLFSETFLESNVLALMGENLLFTINFFGIPEESLSLLMIRDDLQDVLFVRKDLVSFEDSKLSTTKLKTAIKNNTNKITGRWVINPKIENNNFIKNISLSEAFKIEEIEFKIIDRHIVAKRPGYLFPSFIEHTISPVDQIFQEKALKSKNPTIIVFMPFLAVGGAEKLTLDIILRLKDRFDFLIVTVESPDPSIGEQSHVFRKVTHRIFHLAEFSLPGLFLSNLSYFIMKYDVKKLFVANGANWFYDEVCNVKKAFPGLNIINQVYDHQFGWINRMTPQISQAIDIHIAVNRSIERTYIEKYGIPDKKIRLIHHGIDISEFDYSKFNAESINILRKKLALPEHRLIVSFIARFHPQKRPLDFLKLAKSLEHDERFFFLIVGDGSLADEVNRYIDFNNLINIKRLTFYEPIAEILSLTDILVITSEYEGLPLILLDALAMAVPVVSTHVGCISEVIKSGENGIMVEKIGDINAFEQAVLTLAKVDDLKIWGLRGRELVASDFNIEKVTKAYENVFSEN